MSIPSYHTSRRIGVRTAAWAPCRIRWTPSRGRHTIHSVACRPPEGRANGAAPAWRLPPGYIAWKTSTAVTSCSLPTSRWRSWTPASAGNGEAIVEQIRKLGRSPSDLRWIIVTHFHFDHSGSAAELHELTGASIVAHSAETVAGQDGELQLRKGNEGESPPSWYRWALRVDRRRRRQAAPGTGAGHHSRTRPFTRRSNTATWCPAWAGSGSSTRRGTHPAASARF